MAKTTKHVRRSNRFFVAMPKLSSLVFIGFVLAASLSGCITRSETDYYTLTVRDTTRREMTKNAPGSTADNGVVFPSSREVLTTRQTMSYDSSSERDYPAFLRYGGLEFAGLITNTGYSGVGPGLFGVYSLLDTLGVVRSGKLRDANHALFKGFMVRFMPVEYRLRWFNDAADWTIGTSAFEYWNRSEKDALYSFVNVYVRKRYWVREKIPYVIFEPFVGIGAAPSLYLNLGGEFHLGSFGGFNLRAYGGYIAGLNYSVQPISTVDFAYAGLGVSALDFTNKVEETMREWKDYTHSAIEVSALEITALHSFSSTQNFFDSTLNLPISGMNLRLATAHFPLPFADGHFWAGTTLFNFFALGFTGSSVGILPLQIGYRKYFIAEDLSLEPAVELNYFPSQFANVSLKLRLDTFFGYTIGLVGGYAGGNTGAFLSSLLARNGSHISSSFGAPYLGVTIGIKDYLITPERVALERAHEP